MLRRLYEWTMAKASHRHAEWWLALFAFVEASFFPIPPHPVLGVMCLAEPKKAVRFALIATLASVAGGVLGYAIGWGLYDTVGTQLLALLGLNSFNTIPRSEDPHFPIPIVVVRAVLPGASPSEMEQLVAKPIEDAVNGLDEIKSVQSSSGANAAVVRVEFSWNGDPERRYDQVVREVNAIRGNLPQGLTRLEVQRSRTTEVAVFQAALTSDTLPMRRLEKVARRLRDRLNRAPGVREAKYWGATPSEVRVALDLARLAQLKLPASAVTDALRSAGAETRGPKPLSRQDLSRFLSALDLAVVRLQRKLAGQG